VWLRQKSDAELAEETSKIKGRETVHDTKKKDGKTLFKRLKIEAMSANVTVQKKNAMRVREFCVSEKGKKKIANP